MITYHMPPHIACPHQLLRAHTVQWPGLQGAPGWSPPTQPAHRGEEDSTTGMQYIDVTTPPQYSLVTTPTFQWGHTSPTKYIDVATHPMLPGDHTHIPLQPHFPASTHLVWSPGIWEVDMAEQHPTLELVRRNHLPSFQRDHWSTSHVLWARRGTQRETRLCMIDGLLSGITKMQKLNLSVYTRPENMPIWINTVTLFTPSKKTNIKCCQDIVQTSISLFTCTCIKKHVYTCIFKYHIARNIVLKETLVDFNLAVFYPNYQSTKFNSPPIFPAIW